MPLRRVTLSGRLAEYESEEPERIAVVLVKGIAAVLFDIAVALGIATIAFLLFMAKLVAPYERGFYCYEVESLSNPFYPGTITTRHLLWVSLGLPLLCVLFVEAIFFRSAKGSNRLRKYFSSVTYVFLEYIVAYTLATFIMESVKCCFARLRPHYISVCKPDWSRIDCSDPNKFIENAHCLSTDEHRIRVGRQSFPSGHSAAAVLLLTFIYVYLTGLVKASNIPTLRYLRRILLVLVGVWTLIVLITRVTDYWHHPTDVLGGIVLGFSCIYFPFGRRSISKVYQTRFIEDPHM
uniref:Phosphatidic acid phosphatase type 2/haloperoxidase domain-containing protein n=1 Tax=Parascaris univalens TaxID=6257 RepID=A0A915AN79_PARUN